MIMQIEQWETGQAALGDWVTGDGTDESAADMEDFVPAGQPDADMPEDGTVMHEVDMNNDGTVQEVDMNNDGTIVQEVDMNNDGTIMQELDTNSDANDLYELQRIAATAVVEDELNDLYALAFRDI